MKKAVLNKLILNGIKSGAGVRNHDHPFSWSLIKVLVLPALLFFLFFSGSFSQCRPGIILGYSHAKFGGPDAKAWGFLDSDAMFAPRFHIGGYVSKDLLENLFGEAGLVLSTRGTRYKGETEIYDPITFQFTMVELTLNKRLTYISLPILFRYYITESFNLGLGPEIAFLLAAKAIEKAGSDSEKEKTDVLHEYNKMDLSVKLAACYYLTEAIFLQLAYLHGLNDIVKYEDEYASYKVMNRVIQLSLCYALRPLKSKG